MPDTGGKTIVDTIREYEEHKYHATVRQLGDTANVPELLSGLYDFFLRSFEAGQTADHADYVPPLVFLLSCQYQLVIATLAAERGHLSDAFQATRRAVESCAFGRRVALHPHLAELWQKVGYSPDDYEKYREKFGTGKLFPDNDPTMTLLYERYDWASKQMHSTIHSMAGRIQVHENDRGLAVDFAYFEVDHDKDPGEPIRTLMWVWDTHLHIIRAFEQTLRPMLKVTEASWQVRYSSVEVALQYHKNKWRDKAAPPKEPPPEEWGGESGS